MSRYSHVLSVAVLATVVSVSGGKAARADVVGRLKFAVKNAADEKPLVGAKIVLKDSSNVRPPVTLTTDATGSVITPPLENRVWNVTVSADQYQTDTRDVTVSADTTTDVEVLLEPLTEKIIKVTGAKNLVSGANTSSSVKRDQSFAQKYPVAAGNPQSLTKTLRANPGFVEDSVNQAHPRGEHSQTSIYINGFLLPGALQGRAGQFLAPSAIQTVDVLTGGFAPEYGSELGAVLNLTLRAGAIAPFSDVRIGGGGFGTFQGDLTFGGQGGAAYGTLDAQGKTAKRFSYLVNVTQRSTNNALEAPQPDDQSAHNFGTSTTLFGNFDYRLGDRGDQISLILNTAPARTEIANRTGLPSEYARYGQGYGYGGAQAAGATTTDAAGNTVALRSQNELGQDVYQKDNNSFATLQYRRQFNTTTTGQFSVGFSRSRLDILNDSPDIDLGNLPDDSSIEFNPTIKRRNDQTQIQASVTASRGIHTFKFGGLYSDQEGSESYRLVPGSQTALNALYAIDAGGNLVPSGGVATTNEDGSVSYALPTGGTYSSPTLNVDRSGYYAALYAQDTWKATRKLTANYGLRLDAYRASQNLGQDTVNDTELSPRVNLAYSLSPVTIVRASYNRLFSQPPLAQGAILGQSVKPQTVNLYEASVERQILSNQTVKAAYYQKNIHNLTDTGILIEGTQIGAYSTLNLERAVVKGFELSYDLTPRNNVGFGGYLSWANATSKPSGKTSTGEDLPIGGYTDHDQLNTISAGVNYALKGGTSLGASYYYGSGVESSRLTDPVTGETHGRQDRSELNVSLSTPRPMGNKGGVGAELAVENVFDSREVINFQSPFSGTRFQQGRRVLLSLSGRF